MASAASGYYRTDLALVHHRGYGFHAAACAPGILELLGSVKANRGLVLELGCGSGLLTKELIAAGHRIIATDASAAMLEIAREVVGNSAEIHQLTLPDDPLPRVDAIVAVGHPLNYLANADEVDRALIAIGAALNPGGTIAFDICDLDWGKEHPPNLGRAGRDWAIIAEFSRPAHDRFVRDITTFVANADGSWRRDQEHHENVLIETARIPGLLADYGIEASVGSSLGTEQLPRGLRLITGHRPS